MAFFVFAGVGLILFVGFVTGRKDVAPVPSGRMGCKIPLLILVVCVIACVIMWPTFTSYPLFKGVSAALQPGSAATHTAQAVSSKSVQGDPDISASFIENVLVQAHSPAQGQGLGQVIYDEGKQYHIKPSFALAVFHMESDYGVKGVAPTLRSIGNIRNGPNSYRSYATWAESVSDFYHVIQTVYLAKGLTTVAQIMPIYAPASDDNNPTQYVQVVQADMQSWSQQG